MIEHFLSNWQWGIVVPVLTYVLLFMGARELAARRGRRVGISFHIFALLLSFRLGSSVYVGHITGYRETAWWKALEGTAVLAGAVVLVQVVCYLFYDFYLPSRRKVRVPRLLHDLTAVLVLAVAISVILKIEFNLSLPAILTTSTILAAIIGLSLQELLGNLVAGVTLQSEKPFAVGDWVSVGGQEGEVVGMSWRATRIETIDGWTVVVPNATISKGQITNYSAPTRTHARRVTVGVEYGAPPSAVKQCLASAALQAPGVLRDPPPSVRILEFGDSSIVYDVKYWIEDHALIDDIRDGVMTAIWYGLRRQKLEIPFPIRTVQVRKAGVAAAARSAAGARDILSKVALFTSLPADQITKLAEGSEVVVYGDGETVIREGDPGQSLYVVEDGHAEVEVLVNGSPHTLDVLMGPGDYFGEMSMLTGEPRSATIRAKGDLVLLCIDREDIAPVLEAWPRLMEEMSQVLARRRMDSDGYIREKMSEAAEAEEVKAFSEKILHSIRRFFGKG